MKHIILTLGDIDIGTSFNLNGVNSSPTYMKTNMFHSETGEIYCCNLSTGVLDIFPEGTVVDVNNSIEFT